MAVTPVPLAFTDMQRLYADLPPATMKNRVLEQTTTQAGQQVFLLRWASTDVKALGGGPIRATYSLTGLFNSALFAVSGETLYRYDPDGTTMAIGGTVFGTPGSVSMIGVRGAGYERLFLADGSHLQVYQGGSHATGTLTGTAAQATGTLTGTANVADGNKIQIGATFYMWSATVVAGSGSAASPWVVLRGATLQLSLANLASAIMATGTPGTTYSAGLTVANSDVTATSATTTLTATAIAYGTAGNTIATLVPVGTTVAWGAATLTGGASTNVADGDTVRIGASWYKWSATIVNGTGSAALPWVVKLGADLTASLANLVKTISFTGVAGTDYSANLGGQSAEVTAVSDATTLTATAISDLASGNLIATTETSASLSWGAATLTGGGLHGLSGVEVPDGLPPNSVAVLRSYVVIGLGGTDKFFWINPGELTIDPLSFATAESRPDSTFQVLGVGDTLWFVGSDSIEVWYPTGDANAPFAPVSGRSYEIGAAEGTAVNIKGTVYLVGNDGVVYAVAGSPARISDNGVEELIRRTLEVG